VRNASERKDIRRAEKLAAELERKRIDFVVAAMDTIPGRAWFHDFLSRCHVFADPFTGDALLEAYSKGERNIGLGVYLDIVTHCPDSFVQMMREANIQEVLNDRRSQSDTADAELPGGEDGDGGD
jgi:hypothetical protein